MDLENGSKHLISFGVLTDVQYADRDDHPSWCCKEKIRYYRNSINSIHKAFQSWETSPRKVKFAMQLGDLLDGSNSSMKLNPTSAILKLLEVFAEFPKIPTYHVLGNHELYNFNRAQLQKFFGLAFSGQEDIAINACIPNNETNNVENDNGLAYYSFSPIPELLIIVLDCFDISLPGYEATSSKYKTAENYLRKYHTTDDKDMWEYDDHLVGLEKRFLSFNGALDEEQLQWLDKQLHSADSLNQKAIVCGHIAIYPESSHNTCVMWNYEEILAVLHRYSSVIAYLAGHLHDSGYAQDSHGIHHISFAGIIETSPDSNAFATVHVFEDHIHIEGHGREHTYILPISNSLNIEEQSVNCPAVEVKVVA